MGFQEFVEFLSSGQFAPEITVDMAAGEVFDLTCIPELRTSVVGNVEVKYTEQPPQLAILPERGFYGICQVRFWVGDRVCGGMA